MPTIEVTRDDLEDLIQAVMYTRLNVALEEKPDTDFLLRLTYVHQRLENALEQWIYGWEEKIIIPENFLGKGIYSWTKVHPPHDEGCDHD